GAFAQGADVDAEGLDGIAEALFGVLGDAVVHLDALVRLRDVRELGLVDLDELFPLAGRLIERLEDLSDDELLHATLQPTFQRRERFGMLGGSADALAVGLDGLVDVAEPELVTAAEPVPEFQDLVGALSDLRFTREDLGELAPSLGLGEEAVERTDGDLVLG